jgi:dipeptidyl aminopeptidase/acylaminoacyl peptidase
VASFEGDKGPTKREWHTISATGENNRKLELPESFEPEGFTKDGDSLYGTYEVEKKTQLGIVPLASGRPTQIIALPNGIRSALMAPDGARFAITADPRPLDVLAEVRHVAENDVAGLYVVPLNGGAGSWWCPELKDITDVAWSADGSQLAVVWSVPVAGGRPVDLTPKLAGSIVSVGNGPHGTAWIELHKGTAVEVNSFHEGKLEAAYHWPDGVVGLPVFSPFASAPDVLAFTVGDPAHADNVAVVRQGELHKITNEGDDTLAKLSLGKVGVVQWTAKDGTKLEGILTQPGNYEAGKKYPFLVFPHGGPEANDELRFDSLARFIAGLGYIVLQPEYRGSTGYGSEFLDSIYQHFGDRAYGDVDSATDFAVAQGWADPQRLAIFGWSAGGFMTSWTVTQTHRYKAAVEGAGITDWMSFIPTSDIAQVDYDRRLQEKDPAPLLQFSAVMHADQVTTPLLILHGESDIRVPTFQGREFFVLLAERGKTVRMVTYPGSPHFPRLAEQRRNLLAEIKDWLAKYNP